MEHGTLVCFYVGQDGPRGRPSNACGSRIELYTSTPTTMSSLVIKLGSLVIKTLSKPIAVIELYLYALAILLNITTEQN